MPASTQRFPAFAVPLLLAVAVLGYLTGMRHVSATRSSAPAPAATQVAAGAEVALEYPVGWRREPAGPAIPGLVLSRPLWLGADGGGAAATAGLEAGSLQGTPASPLPPAIRSRLRGLPRVEVVSLAALQALRYPDVRLTGYRQRLELYVVPSPATGEIVMACHAPASPAKLLEQCEQIVSSVSLAGQSTSDVTPDPVYAHRLAALLSGLGTARRSDRARMSSAKDTRVLAVSAVSLASAFLHGAGLLARLEAPPVAGAAQVVLARAMISAAGAYSALAEAARARHASGYRVARARVTGAELGVDQALENFDLLGYGGRG